MIGNSDFSGDEQSRITGNSRFGRNKADAVACFGLPTESSFGQNSSSEC